MKQTGAETEMKKILTGILMVIMLAAAMDAFAESTVETATDPILDLYPGLELGMSTEEIYEKYGEDGFEKMAFDTDTVVFTMEDGQTVTSAVSDLYLRSVHHFRGGEIAMVFEIDQNRLITIGVQMKDADLLNELITDMTKVYGEIEQPAVSDTLPLLGLVDLMTGNQKYGWKTDTMIIEIQQIANSQMITYRPLQ